MKQLLTLLATLLLSLHSFAATNECVITKAAPGYAAAAPATGQTVLGKVPEGFEVAASLLFKGHQYLYGTLDGRKAFLQTKEGGSSFKELPPCPGDGGSTLVYQHNGRDEAFYLLGGKETWQYVPVSEKWELKASNEGGLSRNVCAVACGSAHILVFDGGCVLAYHTVTDTWVKLPQSGETLPEAVSASNTASGVEILGADGQTYLLSINDKTEFNKVNYIIVGLYLLIMMVVGYYFSRRNGNSDQFFKGGGNIPWWAAGISIFATALSAITFLAIPAKTYATDWRMFIFNMTIIMTVPIVSRFYLPLFRKLSVASAYEYLETRFSSGVRTLSSAFFVIFMFARVAIVLFLPSLALNAVTGINIYLCILLMGAVTLIYCTMGGIEAVVWADVIQGVLLIGGALAALCWLFHDIDGGFIGTMKVACANSKFNLVDLKFDWTQPVFWVALIGGMSNQLLTYTSDQSVIQKYLTVKETRDTERGLWLNGLITIPSSLLFFGIGTALFVYFKQQPEMLRVGMTNTDSIFPLYIMRRLPDGLSGLLIAAVFSAAMSTLSSNINSSTTVMTEDFYAKFSRREVTPSSKVRFARIAGLVAGTLGIAIALALATYDVASLWDQFNFFLGLLTSGLGGLFMMGIFTRRIGPKAAVTGFLMSAVVLLLVHRFTSAAAILYGFMGLVSSFVIGYLASFIFGKGK